MKNIFYFSYFLLKCYLSQIIIPFERNFLFKNETFNLENLLYNDLVINISIGSEKQKIPLSLRFFEYPTFIIGKNNSEKLPYFDEEKSITFSKNKTIQKYVFLPFTYGYDSNDNIYINNKEINNFNFILATQLDQKISITTQLGIIGLNQEYYRDNQKEIINKKNIINQLKEKKIISSYLFSIKYNEEDKGELIIGEYPHNYDKKNYNKNLYTEIRINYFKNEYSRWQIIFDNVKYGNEEIKRGNKVIFSIEYGMLYSTRNYKAMVDKEFFFQYTKTFKCKFQVVNIEKKSEQSDYVYYCDKDVDISKLKKLTFYNKNLNMTFEFDYNDLFELHDDKYYFLVLMRKNSDIWFLGKPFFKKYQLIFNQDNKVIGFYDYKKVIPSNVFFYLRIILILILVIIIGYLFYYIIKNKFMKKKKNKAQELDINVEDDYLLYKDK